MKCRQVILWLMLLLQCVIFHVSASKCLICSKNRSSAKHNLNTATLRNISSQNETLIQAKLSLEFIIIKEPALLSIILYYLDIGESSRWLCSNKMMYELKHRAEDIHPRLQYLPYLFAPWEGFVGYANDKVFQDTFEFNGTWRFSALCGPEPDDFDLQQEQQPSDTSFITLQHPLSMHHVSLPHIFTESPLIWTTRGSEITFKKLPVLYNWRRLSISRYMLDTENMITDLAQYLLHRYEITMEKRNRESNVRVLFVLKNDYLKPVELKVIIDTKSKYPTQHDVRVETADDTILRELPRERAHFFNLSDSFKNDAEFCGFLHSKHMVLFSKLLDDLPDTLLVVEKYSNVNENNINNVTTLFESPDLSNARFDGDNQFESNHQRIADDALVPTLQRYPACTVHQSIAVHDNYLQFSFIYDTNLRAVHVYYQPLQTVFTWRVDHFPLRFLTREYPSGIQLEQYYLRQWHGNIRRDDTISLELSLVNPFLEPPDLRLEFHADIHRDQAVLKAITSGIHLLPISIVKE